MKIVFATDGSEYAEEAAKFLTRLSFSPEDSILVLHVISELPYADDYYAQIRQAIRRVAPSILKSALHILKPVKAHVTSLEKEGYPDSAIVETATDAGADLIVMGARGVTGIKLMVLGNTARAVAISSPVPVMAVKRPSWKSSGPMKILFATDGSGPADETATLLSAMPFPEGSEITVMHVIGTAVSDIPEKFAIEIQDGIKEHAARVRAAEFGKSEEVLDHARELLSGSSASIQGFSKTGDPSWEILNAEKIVKPDVVAVGCRGLRGIRGMMGSVSRRVLGRSESSVLVGKACSH